MSARCPTLDRLEFDPSVVLLETGGDLHIKHSLWDVKLPSAQVNSDPGLMELVTIRSVARASLGRTGLGLVALLEAQGCFLADRQASLSAPQVLRLFKRARSRLYAQYYSHPLWSDLRSGRAGSGAFIAWVLHNYHVSRSAGPIAARLSTLCHSNIGERFAHDAVDEYWHCDSFYFVEGASVGVTPAEAKAAVPLPGSTAFEDLARRTAEEDPLGHVLIALFQEASILFKSDAEAFYDQVEQTYGIPRFFTGWRRHMLLDEDHNHASGVEAALHDIGTVSSDAFEASLRRVQLAHFFLTAALDQAATYSANAGTALRRPEAIIAATEAIGPVPLGREPASWLITSLKAAAMRSLAYARRHDEIMAAGRLCVSLDGARAMKATANPWLTAAGHFLMDRAHDVNVLLAIAQEIGQSVRDELPQYANLAASTSFGQTATSEARIAVAQIRELLSLAKNVEPLPTLPIFTRM